jgi:hypothetical protein
MSGQQGYLVGFQTGESRSSPNQLVQFSPFEKDGICQKYLEKYHISQFIKIFTDTLD